MRVRAMVPLSPLRVKQEDSSNGENTSELPRAKEGQEKRS